MTAKAEGQILRGSCFSPGSAQGRPTMGSEEPAEQSIMRRRARQADAVKSLTRTRRPSSPHGSRSAQGNAWSKLISSQPRLAACPNGSRRSLCAARKYGGLDGPKGSFCAASGWELGTDLRDGFQVLRPDEHPSTRVNSPRAQTTRKPRPVVPDGAFCRSGSVAVLLATTRPDEGEGFAAFVVEEVGVDRSGEARIVELDREIVATLAGALRPSGTNFSVMRCTA
jgi:hypothetical protein